MGGELPALERNSSARVVEREDRAGYPKLFCSFSKRGKTALAWDMFPADADSVGDGVDGRKRWRVEEAVAGATHM